MVTIILKNRKSYKKEDSKEMLKENEISSEEMQSNYFVKWEFPTFLLIVYPFSKVYIN